MSASRPTGIEDDDTLEALWIRMKALEDEHRNIQEEYTRLYAYHRNRCASSLRSSVKGLFEVIVFVRKADKKLVDWHHRSHGLKTALRIFGVDRRTQAVIEKKTQKLQAKVQRVEKDFDRTGTVFDGGLDDAKHMRTSFLEFSTENVEEGLQEVLAARDAYGEEYERVNKLVKQQNDEYEDAEKSWGTIMEGLREVDNNRGDAQRSQTAWSAFTVFGLGASALSAFVFPPSLLTTGPLLIATVAAGRTVLSYNEQIQNLESQQRALASAFSRHDDLVNALRAELVVSRRDRDACKDAMHKIDEFQSKSETLRSRSQKSLDELYGIHTVLDKTREKIRIMSQELHECRYEETRRGIALRLREALGAIQDVPKKIKSVDAIDMTKAIGELIEIDKRTEEVLQITRLSVEVGSN